MRSVTKETVKAFLAGKKRTVGNTSTDGKTLKLHGNTIATKLPSGAIEATLAGWGSPTTRERLNGLCQELGFCRSFGQRKGEQFFGNSPILTDERIFLVNNSAIVIREGAPVLLS